MGFFFRASMELRALLGRGDLLATASLGQRFRKVLYIQYEWVAFQSLSKDSLALSLCRVTVDLKVKKA